MTTDIDAPANRDLCTLRSRAIEDRLGDLIRHYVAHPSRDLARSVVRHLEALYLHPDYDSDCTQRCAYRRLAQHWRWLSDDLSRAAGD